MLDIKNTLDYNHPDCPAHARQLFFLYMPKSARAGTGNLNRQSTPATEGSVPRVSAFQNGALGGRHSIRHLLAADVRDSLYSFRGEIVRGNRLVAKPQTEDSVAPIETVQGDTLLAEAERANARAMELNAWRKSPASTKGRRL